MFAVLGILIVSLAYQVRKNRNCHLQKLDMGQAGVAVSDSFWEISESFSTRRTGFDVAQ